MLLPQTVALKDGSQCQIRACTIDDYPAIKDMLQTALMFDDTWDSEVSVSLMLQQDPTAILVAVIGEEVVGSIYINVFGHWVYFWRLVTATAHQKKGVATTLLKVAEQLLKSRDIPEAAIFVNDSNKALKKFYSDRGWQISGTFRSLWKKV
jgi:ribosomal protein S18 acetylase RimI-like enzyme